MKSEQYSYRRSAAFTLIEMMLVVVIIGVSASLVVPSLMGLSKKSELEGNARSVLSFVNYAHSLSTSRGRYFKLGYDEEKSRFVLKSEVQPLEEPGVYEDVHWPASISGKMSKEIEEVSFATKSQNGSEETEELLFYPDGSTTDGIIIIKGKKNKAYTIFLIGATGVAVLKEGGDVGLYDE